MPQHSGPRLPNNHVLSKITARLRASQKDLLSCPISENTIESDRRVVLGNFCVRLLNSAHDPSAHLERLNESLWCLLPNAFGGDARLEAHHSPRRSFSEDTILHHRTTNLLYRFPRWPPRLLSFPLAGGNSAWSPSTLWDWTTAGTWAKDYLMPEASRWTTHVRFRDQTRGPATDRDGRADKLWTLFCVTTFIDEVSLLLVAKLADENSCLDIATCRAFRDYCNTLAELLDVFEQLCLRDEGVDVKNSLLTERVPGASLFSSQDYEQARAIAKAFLWSAWQRSVLILYFQVVRSQVFGHFDPDWASLLAIRGLRRFDYVDIGYLLRNRTSYLCGWSLKLLRRSRSSLSLDFRHLIRRFNEQFPTTDGRCLLNSTSSCGSGHLYRCQRFLEMQVPDQSAHQPHCKYGCQRLLWDETSYISSPHPRAVSTSFQTTHLRYCAASPRTMAITHVWSHGQGGNPDVSGFNKCLHEHYCELARSHSCDSYWIDSACIPNSEILRHEAITGINKVFSQSKAVLVSDRDLRSVDIHRQSIESFETVLSVLLLSDWMVRAWTMLEASRANRCIYLLCKDDFTISLKRLSKRIFNEGDMSLAALLGCAEYLLPLKDPTATKDLAHAGQLLSQRYASRPGDDCVIWGLLANIHPTNDPKTLWRSQEKIRTGFLMSSAQRVPAYGLNWAPQSPCTIECDRIVVVHGVSLHYGVRYFSFDGSGSLEGDITPHGLRSKWLYREIDACHVEEYWKRHVKIVRYFQSQKNRLNREYWHRNVISEGQDVYDRPDMARACQRLQELLVHGNRARLLRPLADDGETPYEHGTNRGDRRGPTAALCLLPPNSDAEEQWIWSHVYEWCEPTDRPAWQVGEMLLV